MTAGRHPFGDRLERDVNIVKNKKDLFLVEFLSEAEDLFLFIKLLSQSKVCHSHSM